MSAKFWIDEDVCEICGGPVDVLVKQGGRPVKTIAQSATCRQGCSGQVLSQRRMAKRRA